MLRRRRSFPLAFVLLLFVWHAPCVAGAAGPDGQLTWAVHTTLVEESGLGLIAGYAYSAPYEDLKLKSR